jgi:hypothetical protein
VRFMVTVAIKWSGREESISERLGVVKDVLGGLPCFETSPIESNYASYICRDAVINVDGVFGTVSVEIIGVDNNVFSYAIITASRIKKYIEEKVGNKEWGVNDPETSVYANLYETEVKCGCES